MRPTCLLRQVNNSKIAKTAARGVIIDRDSNRAGSFRKRDHVDRPRNISISCRFDTTFATPAGQREMQPGEEKTMSIYNDLLLFKIKKIIIK